MPTNWLPIDDFSAGIWTAPGFGFAGGLQAPQGAMQGADTFRCIPGAGGKGLGPGPGYSSTTTMPVAILAEGATITSSNLYLNGFHTWPAQPFLVTSILGVMYRTNTPARRQKLVSLDQGANYLITTQSGTTASALVAVGLTPIRMNPTTPYLTPGNPTMAFSIMQGGSFANRELGVFPNPTAPGNNKLNFTVGNGGNIIGHQGRLVVLEDASWTINGGGVTGLAAQGEQISFSDPANSNTFPGTLQQEVFYPENASGYGAWGSLSAGSLLLVKQQGGAILIEGDIAAPRVTYLPGVQSTGRLVTDAAVSSLGVVYGSDRNGLWVWDGGPGSKKLSAQLGDYFYRDGSAATVYETGGDSSTEGQGLYGGPTLQVMQWQEYIVVSANWLYHIPTGGWWRLDDITTASGQRDHLFFRGGSRGDALLGSLVRTSGVTGTQNVFNTYTSTVPATSWSAHLHPIKVTNDTDVMVNEIVLEAQRDTSGTGTSTVTLTLYNADGTTQALDAWTVTSSARPERKRFQCQSLGNFIEIKIVAANSSTAPAPTVLSMTVGWETSNLAPNG